MISRQYCVTELEALKCGRCCGEEQKITKMQQKQEKSSCCNKNRICHCHCDSITAIK